jgi:nucleoside-diphosphate kinase
MIEKTLVLVKPDGVERKLITDVAVALEAEGLHMKEMRVLELSKEQAETCTPCTREVVFDRNILHVTSGPVIAFRIEGEAAVSRARKLVEHIREEHKDWVELPKNLVHATDSPEKASHELNAVGFD